jgi:D-beta-D-heptose 7-phosphate kinase/D-beta-D-heptose 1-phosphate adenosyltransferase
MLYDVRLGCYLGRSTPTREGHLPIPSAAQARSFVARFAGRRILVLGDLMTDRYLWGRVERISPEAPVPVVSIDRETDSLGGSANVAHNLSSLGARVELLGLVGADAAGQRLCESLTERGVDASGVTVDRTRRTTVKTRVIAHPQQVVRTDEEDADDASGDAEARLIEAIERAVPLTEAVIVSDYGKGVITRATLDAVLGAAKRARVPVCVDPKETHFFNYKGVAVLTPNVHEAGRAFGRTLRNEETLLEAGASLRERLDADALLITRGPDGMSLFSRDGSVTHLPTVAREVFDVTGAGDTVVSVYALALASGAPAETCAFLANHAAGLVIRHAGTAVTTREELIVALSAEPLAPAEA